MIAVNRATYLYATAIACATLNLSFAEDWPQFRGVNSSGISASKSVVAEFGPGTNELWSTTMRSGHSSPCVVGNSIYLTTYDAGAKQLE